ncbi:guanitoxin biosynthesis heme-dependent pre-guanitoxin N-hydroxylase GntA [Acidovorax sp. CCYZU-2555]|uniref:guanitoxin biosynthesis heme-dependent pre-guanitoxin N-hydroxylase GntA n=1 Tax=Acidovorax sp. CCYZU-2555 TaxID=2835042 RepID=UPI001BD15021|nr:guanitoxin biosynthesis heme-dependent pre-guanitoxin N-hydroxylase GntA [Acidovorax sp. CCYZU-2555]MBS7777198.1 YqcI/YcgG family protein [Acidovorax sp. CCYZU-2555]
MHLHPCENEPNAPAAAGLLKEFIADKSFPCVGAKSALNKGRMQLQEFGELGDESLTPALHAALVDYSRQYPDPGMVPVSFIAVFRAPQLDELRFEQRMWRQLRALHAHDCAHGIPWASGVGDDPLREDFSFSVGGRAFFVVGMHPGASRLARRTPMPCLVFNFHEQFEQLKASGKYTLLQEAIRTRDIALQGSINPVLARFGEASEARQYSGRAVEADWQCPFHSKAQKDA